ncbi:hypothetical protein LLD17_01375 [Lactococcus cremoris]|uniref:hypothetical protein n=1 Tax=Lactococcus lactis subsp. cremoris TaxID=1359 RepID=UPI0024A76BD3|nr:hypothetical protein [Lactococcus cremoris]
MQDNSCKYKQSYTGAHQNGRIENKGKLDSFVLAYRLLVFRLFGAPFANSVNQ